MAAMDELIVGRNKKALAAFDQYGGQYAVVYIPWGAAHMPDFEKQLKARGYVVKSSELRQIARYETILEALSPTKPAVSAPVSTAPVN
jgi:hypothetical protein